MTIPMNIADADAEILKGAYGADKGQVEAGLTSDFNDLVVTRVKKQMDDASKADVTTKIDQASAEHIKRVQAILAIPEEKLAMIDAALEEAK